MKKTKQQEKTGKNPLLVQKDGAPLKQKQVPFLYIAMREPSAEYKKAFDSKQKLYRFIKIK